MYERSFPSHPGLARHETLVAETDRLDSAQLSEDDVVAPSGFILLGLTLDARTGLGSLRDAGADARNAENVSTLQRNG